MDVFEAILNRRSIRAFKSDPIPADLLDKILEAARWAPSAGNCQARDFILVTDSEGKRDLCKATLGQDFIEKAPLDLVVCANEERSARRYGARGRDLYCVLDAAASVQNILLAVHALGLGACWIEAFNDAMVANVLNIPKGVRPIAIIPIGYPAEKPWATPRKRLEDLVHTNQYEVKRRGFFLRRF
jgi:nitroreductase